MQKESTSFIVLYLDLKINITKTIITFMHFSPKSIYLLLIGILCLTACQKEESKGTEITSFSVVKSNNELIFNFSASDQNIQYYEIIYSNSNSSHRGDFTTTETSTITKTISELSIESGGIYTFNIYAKLSDLSVISWSNAVLLNFGDFCEPPHGLNFNGYFGLIWNNYNNTTSTSYYEMSYGVTGTSASAGEKITTNNTSSRDMVLEQGKVYDFYVRGYCNNTLGWSDWAGPLTHYASENFNICIPPSNLSFSIVRDSLSRPFGAECTWEDNGGNSDYELNLVSNGSSPTSGNIETVNSAATSVTVFYGPLTRNRDYDFYVRSICKDGTPTSWTGPLNVNIN